MVAVAVKVTLEPTQIVVWLAEAVTVGVTLVAVMVIGALTAVGVVVQVASLVRITVTWSLLFRVVLVYVSELVPASVPLTCHW